MMAWATLDQNGTVTAVGFDVKQIVPHDSAQIIEISDSTAAAVMDGVLQLQHVVVAPGSEPEPAQFDHAAYSSRYPAMMHERDVDALITLARQLPAGAIAVESGSRFGGSAKILLDHAPTITRLYCLDPDWADPESPWIRQDPAITAAWRSLWNLDDYSTCFAYASALLQGYHNVRLLPLASPYDIAWWQEQIDFIFEDSQHTNPQMNDNLNFWLPRLRSGGIIAGHDYSTSWPDVVKEADALAQMLGVQLHRQSSIWWVIKP
jgi:predicted O-methyltransferase YrrM